MADYKLSHTAQEVDELLGKVKGGAKVVNLADYGFTMKQIALLFSGSEQSVEIPEEQGAELQEDLLSGASIVFENPTDEGLTVMRLSPLTVADGRNATGIAMLQFMMFATEGSILLGTMIVAPNEIVLQRIGLIQMQS